MVFLFVMLYYFYDRIIRIRIFITVNVQGEKQTCNVEMRHLYKRIYFNPGTTLSIWFWVIFSKNCLFFIDFEFSIIQQHQNQKNKKNHDFLDLRIRILTFFYIWWNICATLTKCHLKSYKKVFCGYFIIKIFYYCSSC